ncbi:MAG: hypothetical protein JXQ90_12440 [Cyclobacteriaceae bacterium]
MSIVVMLGCTEERIPEPYTFSSAISGDEYKVWQVSYYTFREEGKADQTYGLQACDYDDQYYFYANDSRTYEIHSNILACGDEDDIFVESTWAVINARATLEIIVPFLSSEKIPWTIEDLDEKDFEISFYLNNRKSIHIFFELVEEG